MGKFDLMKQRRKDHGVAQIHSATNDCNMLLIRPNGGGDLAFETIRFNPDNDDDFIMNHGQTTLRSGSGHGKYATLSKYYRTVDDLHHQFLKLKSRTLSEKLDYPIKTDDYNFANVHVNKITFTGDDYGHVHHANILNADGIIGLESFEADEPEHKATVWLGNMNGASDEAKLLRDLWQSAKEACEYYTTQSPRDGFEFKKTTYKELNL